MRPVIGILPDRILIAVRKRFEPLILQIVEFYHLHIFWLADGREVHARIGDHALPTLYGSPQQVRQIASAVESVIVATQQFESLRVARISGFDQSMREPSASVGPAFGVE